MSIEAERQRMAPLKLCLDLLDIGIGIILQVKNIPVIGLHERNGSHELVVTHVYTSFNPRPVIRPYYRLSAVLPRSAIDCQCGREG